MREQFVVRAYRGDRAVVHDDDLIGVLDGRHALSDDELGRVGDLFAERLADERVRLGIDRRRRVVEDQYLWLFEQCARNAKSLLLTARDVAAALLDVGVVLVGEALNELVRLCEFADAHQLLVCRVGVAPAQILLDRAREEHVLLQHDRDLIAQCLDVVIAHVYAAHLDAALGHVIKPRDEVDQRSLGAARAAQNAYRLPRLDLEIDLFERAAVRLLGILEVDSVKLDVAVRDLVDGVFGIGQSALFVEHLDDAVGGRLRDRDHDHDHRKHRQRRQRLRRIDDQDHEVAAVERFFCGLHDDHRTDKADHRDRRPHAELHQWVVERNDLFAAREVGAHVLRRLVELVDLVVLAHIRLDDADALDVLLHRLVERVVLFEHLVEYRIDFFEDDEQSRSEYGYEYRKDHAHLPVDRIGHSQRDDHHHRAAERDADDHHIRHLDVGDVRRHTGDEARGRELVDVGEREILNFIVDVVPEVARKACGRGRRILACEYAEQQRERRHDQQDRTVDQNVAHRRLVGYVFEHRRHIQRDHAFEQHFERDEHRRQDGLALVLPDALCQCFQHLSFSFFIFKIFGIRVCYPHFFALVRHCGNAPVEQVAQRL